MAEIYSLPRMTKMAQRLGMRAGWALDLTETDPEDGQPWDFSVPAKQAKAKKMIDEDRPAMLILCPMCGPFSQLNELFNYPKLTKDEVKKKLEAGLEHLKFAAELCAQQYEAGRMFLFEHPASASSWGTRIMQYLAGLPGVHNVRFDFCMMGMETPDAEGNPAPAKKRTGILTNARAVADLLREAQCQGAHKHQPLLDGRAGPCQEYPDKFCRAVCEGVKRELDGVEWKNRLKKTLDVSGPFGKLMQIQTKMEELSPPEEDPFAALYEG